MHLLRQFVTQHILGPIGSSFTPHAFYILNIENLRSARLSGRYRGEKNQKHPDLIEFSVC